MKTALRAIGYSTAIAAVLGAVVGATVVVTFGVAEVAVSFGVSRAAAPLYGMGFWMLIGCVFLGTGAAIDAAKKEASNATA